MGEIRRHELPAESCLWTLFFWQQRQVQHRAARSFDRSGGKLVVGASAGASRSHHTSLVARSRGLTPPGVIGIAGPWTSVYMGFSDACMLNFCVAVDFACSIQDRVHSFFCLVRKVDRRRKSGDCSQSSQAVCWECLLIPWSSQAAQAAV